MRDECTKVGPKKNLILTFPKNKFFPFKVLLTVPLENLFYRKHCVSILKGLEGTHNMTDETHKEMLQVCCVYCIYTKTKNFRKVPILPAGVREPPVFVW